MTYQNATYANKANVTGNTAAQTAVQGPRFESITGLFTRKGGVGMDIRITDDILARLSVLKAGDVLAVFPNDKVAEGKPAMFLKYKVLS